MSGCRDSSGSLIVEALVAITLLGLVGAAAHSLHHVAQDARMRSLERMIATWEMRSRLEADLGAAPSWVALAGPVEVVLDGRELDRETTWRPDGCTSLALHPTTTLGLSAQRPRDGAPIGSINRPHGLRDVGRTSVRTSPETPSSLLVQVVDATGAPAAEAAMVITRQTTGPLTPGPGVVLASTGADGCAAPEGLMGGLHDLVLDLEDHLDRLHRSAREARVVTLLPGIPLRHLVVADRAASLAVAIEGGDGSRLPDRVVDGALDWFVVGDGVAPTTGVTEARRVHPGRQDIVVTVCQAALGIGTSATLTLDAGAHHDVAIRLPSVLLPSITVPAAGARVLARRDTDCPGTSGIRPILEWDLSAGAVDAAPITPDIALPHGPWLIRVETSAGTLLYGPVRHQVLSVGEA